MRKRDIGFEEDWKIETKDSKGLSLLLLFHHVFGLLALLVIILQSLLSLNIIPFAIWLIVLLITVIIDLSSAKSITFEKEIGFGFIIVIAILTSIVVANMESMFFVFILNKSVISFQIVSGLFLTLRFTLTLIYMEFYSEELKVLQAKSKYSKEQMRLYQLNLMKTDFEIPTKQTFSLLAQLKQFFVSSIPSLGLFIVLSAVCVLYAYFIFYITPSDAIAQFMVFPALAFVTLLVVIVLLRLNVVVRNIEMKRKIELGEIDDDEQKDVIRFVIGSTGERYEI